MSGEGKPQSLQLGVASAAISTICLTPLLMKVECCCQMKNEADCLGLRHGENTTQMPAQNQGSKHHRDNSLHPEGTASVSEPDSGIDNNNNNTMFLEKNWLIF